MVIDAKNSIDYENDILSGYKQEAEGMKKEVNKYWKDLESLSSSREVKSAQEKILNYEIKNYLGSKEITPPHTLYEEILKKTKSVGSYETFFVYLSSIGIDFNKTFNELDANSKLNYLSLSTLIQKSDFKNIQNFKKDFLQQREKLENSLLKKASNQQWKDLYKIDTVLGKYGLTENETLQFKKYLDLLQKHPEYNRVQEAGMGTILKLVVIAGVFAAGRFGHKKYEERKKPATTINTESGSLGNIEEIFDVMLRRIPFTERGDITMEQWKHGGNEGFFEQNLINIGNYFQNVKIDKTIWGNVFLKYNLSNAEIPQYIKEVKIDNGTIEERKLIYFYIPEKPELVTNKDGGVVHNRSNEFIGNSDFNNAEEQLDENLKESAKQRVLDEIGYEELLEASNNDLRKKIKKFYEADGSKVEVILQVGGKVQNIEDLAKKHSFNLEDMEVKYNR